MASPENSDLVQALQRHRGFLLQAAGGVTDQQARTRSTVSELTLGGLVKHVANTGAEWAEFMVKGAPQGPGIDWTAIDWSNPPPEAIAYQQGHTMTEDETLDALIERFEQVAAATDAFLAEADLDQKHALPEAPWFEPGAEWSVRRVALHLIAEISQHSGHADIIREAIDGQKTMG